LESFETGPLINPDSKRKVYSSQPGDNSSWFLNPPPAVECAVLDGFTTVIGVDPITESQIGNGASNFQNAVVSSGTQREIFHGMAEHLNTGLIVRAEFFDLTVRHPCV